MRLYADSSALIKLIHEEPESLKLREFLPCEIFTSILTKLEIERFLVATNSKQFVVSRFSFDNKVSILNLNGRLIDQILRIGLPREVRSLDAIHLGSAQSIRQSIEGLLTYDRAMIKAAAKLGLPTFSPGLD